MTHNEEEMFFFIADISGYTQFMLKTQLDYDHGKAIILQLIESLVNQISLPMEIAKLEGDAIFLYIKASAISQGKEDLTQKILHFFSIFSKKLQSMKESKLCNCAACVHLEHLDLKIIGHFGKASIDKIGHFTELTGIDTIVTHRLLKNSIKIKRYFLLTEQAYQKLSFPKNGNIDTKKEHYPDIGTVPIFIYYPSDTPSYPKKPFLLKKIFYFIILDLRAFWIRKMQKNRKFRNLP